MSDDFSGDSPEVDLFGAPIGQIRERWGRPSFTKNEKNQELVALLRAAGWKQERIAAYLGCDEKTLRKHFSRELQHGSDLIEAMALQVTLQKMRQGNSVATGRILDMVDRGRAAVPIAPVAQSSIKAEPLGKKEAANLEARHAHEGTEWGDLLQ